MEFNQILEIVLKIHYFQIRLWNYGFSKRKFTFGYNENGEFYVINSTRNNLFSLMFFGLGLCLSFNLIFIEKAPLISPFIIFYLLLTVFFFRKLLWLIRGYEQITVTSTTINHEFFGSFWMQPQKYSLSKIKNIWYVPKLAFDTKLDELRFKILIHQRTFNRIFFCRTVGNFYLTYINRKINIFSQLTLAEKEFLFKEMNKRFENQSFINEEIISENLFSNSFISFEFSIEG